MLIYVVSDIMENVQMNFEDKLNLLKKTLINGISNSNKIFIMPHVNMDFDAIAASAAINEICKGYRRHKSFIVTNDIEENMETSFHIMYEDLKKRYTFINTEQLLKEKTNNDLLIIVDTNKINLIPIDSINDFKKTIIVDHHKVGEGTIYVDDLFTDLDMSSASEFVFNLIKKFNINIDEYLAQCLLAGIYLDTNRLSRNFKPSTSRAVTELMELGANSDDVNNLFVIANFDSDRRQQRLIDKLIDSTKFNMYNIAITMNDENPYTVYRSEDLARAADYLLKYSIDAAFVIGYIDSAALGEGHRNIISVKARSKMKKNNFVDVSEVMKLFNGGGDSIRAACIIEDEDIFKVKAAFEYLMSPGVSLITNTEETEKVLSLLPKK